MQNSTQFRGIVSLEHSRKARLWRGSLFIPLALAALAWLPTASAVCRNGCDAEESDTYLGEEALAADAGFGGNTAVGAYALQDNYLGEDNTGIGLQANGLNSLGSRNTAVGRWALVSNQNSANTAVGYFTLESNTNGRFNTAIGNEALVGNTTASENTASGDFSLHSNTTGANNTANGAFALQSNTNASDNTAIGFSALSSSTTGSFNTATGQNSLLSNTNGRNNTANGQNALRSNTTGSFNIALGSNAGGNLTTGSNNIDIYSRGLAGDENTIRIGAQGTQTATFVAGISGATVSGGVGVIIDSSGHLGTITSSARYKEAVQPMNRASEAILSLKPVTFRYKHDLDPQGIQQFGLVAEQVEKVDPDLVARDEQGKPYTVRYEAVNVMLLNEFLKAHRKLEEQQQEITTLTAALKEQAAQIQKVSARLETDQAAPRVVAHSR